MATRKKRFLLSAVLLSALLGSSSIAFAASAGGGAAGGNIQGGGGAAQVDPFSETVADPNLPTINKSTWVNSLDVNIHDAQNAFLGTAQPSLDDYKKKNVVFNGVWNFMNASNAINVYGNVVLQEKTKLSDMYHEDTGAFGYITLARTEKTPGNNHLHVFGNWIGGNLDSSQTNPKISYSHKLILTSRWNKIDNPTATNTGLQTDLVTIDGDVYGYTEVVGTGVPYEKMAASPGKKTGFDRVKGLILPPSTFSTQSRKMVYAFGDVTAGDIHVTGSPVIIIKGRIQHPNSFFGTLELADGQQAHLVYYDNGKAGADSIKGYTWAANVDPALVMVLGSQPKPSSSSLSPKVVTAVNHLPMMNRLILDMVGNLHERVGDETGSLVKEANGERGRLWARILGKTIAEQSSGQFAFEGRSRGIQVGARIHGKATAGHVSEQNLSFGVLRSDVTNIDNQHVFPDVKSKTGYRVGAFESAETTNTLYSLGLESTNYGLQHKTYQNWKALAFWGNSKDQEENDGQGLEAVAPTKHHAFGYGLSYEAGRPLKELKHWTVEGESQLTYLSSHYSDFDFGALHVQLGQERSLIGRLGLRMYKAGLQGEQGASGPYVSLDILHDFYPMSDIQVGTGTYRVNYPRTWYSVGLGGQHNVNKNAYLYGQVRYEHNLGTGSGTKHGFRGTAGVNLKF